MLPEVHVVYLKGTSPPFSEQIINFSQVGGSNSQEKDYVLNLTAEFEDNKPQLNHFDLEESKPQLNHLDLDHTVSFSVVYSSN